MLMLCEGYRPLPDVDATCPVDVAGQTGPEECVPVVTAMPTTMRARKTPAVLVMGSGVVPR